MKKTVALILGTAMAIASVAGLAACGKKRGAADVSRRPDPREADAYEVYDYLGEKVGAYKTIGLAINAAVEADKDFTEDAETPDGAKGGYVVRKGSDKHLFDVTKGFGEGNSDCFWYYEEGNKLTGYNCWDEFQSVATLVNSKIISHQTRRMGMSSEQSWNGFALLDAHGRQLLDKKPPVWELSKPMDAGIIAFPARKAGVSGLRYSIDLSDVRITPAYEGVTDEVYAYFGVYIWQDDYVIATGIGCNTETGEWYPFRGTSRDDSFTDIVYNVEGKNKPLFTSTWHSDGEGGYFVPNVKTADIEIKTYRGEYLDDESRYYWEDKLTMVFDAGSKKPTAYELLIDDPMVNNYFNRDVAADNGYVFIAGLDIKNHPEKTPAAPNVDYFNGAKFENFTVTAASVYFPTDEEISDDEYIIAQIDPALRGQWFDALMANDDAVDGTWDYTYLYNYLCTSYEAKDGTDVYNFAFDSDPTAETDVGGKLKEYQDKIDSLSEMTVANSAAYIDTYDEVTKWYGVNEAHDSSEGILQQYLTVLDFGPYEAAKPTYEASFKLTDEGKLVRDELEQLSVISAYDYKGWTAADGNVKGYLWSEAQKFGALLARYDALDELDRTNILRLYSGGEDGFLSWKAIYEGIGGFIADTSAIDITTGKVDMTGTEKIVTREALLKDIIETSYAILKGTYDPTDTPKKGTFNSDDTGNFQRAFHILYLLERAEEEEIEIPAFYDLVLFSRLTDSSRAKSFVKDFRNYIYPALTLSAELHAKKTAGEFYWLDAAYAARINACMVGRNKFDEAGFNWNCVTNTKTDLRNGETNYEIYFGLPNQINNFRGNLQPIFDLVESGDKTVKRTANGLGFTSPVKPLADDPRNLASAEAKAVANAFKNFSSMPKYEFKGWTTGADDKKGYLFSELSAFKTQVKAPYEALTDVQKGEVALIIGDRTGFDAWMKLAADDTILESYPALNAVSFTTYTRPNNTADTKTFSGMELFEQIVCWAYRIQIGGSFGQDGDRAGTGKADLNGAPIPSFYLGLLYEALTEKAGASYKLPAFLTELLTSIDFFSFYETAEQPLLGTFRLAKRIKDENVTRLEDLTGDEMKFLNKVWVESFKMDGTLDWNWKLGHKFEDYFSGAMKYLAKIGGAELTKEVAGEAGSETQPLLGHEYVEIVANFLKGCGYPIDADGWGVKDGTIELLPPEVTVTTAAEIDANFAKLSDITDLTKYGYKGWTTRGANKKGYFYSEALLFGKILEAYNALGDKSGVTAASKPNWNKWKEAYDALSAIGEDKLALTVSAADREEKIQAEYTAGEALGELILIATKGIKLDFDSGINGNVSFRAYFFIQELEGKGVTVPAFIKTALARNELADAGKAKFVEDVNYIIAILKLARALTDDPAHKLTAKEIAMVNAHLVGKDIFADAGFHYAYYTESNGTCKDISWHAKGYKMYFGFGADTELCVYQKMVISYLVENYGAAALKYSGEKAPEDSMMGIQAAIAAPAQA